jgi:hypothetical protein
MKKNPWIIPAATLVVGAVGGFISGRNNTSDASQTTAAETVRNSRTAGRAAVGDEEAKKSGPRAKSMEDALGTPGHSARIKSLIDYYSSLAPDQLAEEAKRLENLPMGERIMASLLLFGRWAEVDPNGAMSHANTMGFAAAFVRPTILQSWASVDPENAAKYYSENPREFAMMGGGPGGQNGAASIAAEWAKQDPEAALAWAGSLSGGDKNRAMTSVIREVAMTDPKKAAELAQAMDPSERGGAYESIARSYGAKNFEEAEIWVKSLPFDQQGDALSSAIAGLSQSNPELALTKAKAMADGDDKNRAIRTSLENLSKTNPTQALSEVAKLDAEIQRRTIEPVISNYVNSDPVAAESYVKNLETGPVRDNAVSALVRGSTGDPATLMPLAASIEDEGDRNRTMGVAYMKWAREDESAAKSYVESSTLPDNVKERLLNNQGGFGRFGGGPPGRRGRGN